MARAVRGDGGGVRAVRRVGGGGQGGVPEVGDQTYRPWYVAGVHRQRHGRGGSKVVILFYLIFWGRPMGAGEVNWRSEDLDAALSFRGRLILYFVAEDYLSFAAFRRLFNSFFRPRRRIHGSQGFVPASVVRGRFE